MRRSDIEPPGRRGDVDRFGSGGTVRVATTRGQGRDMSETNMFDGVTDIRELIGLAIGAGSVCWSNPGGAGEFDSTTAADIVDAAYGRVQMLIADSFSAEVAS